MERQLIVVLYVLLLIAVIVSVDFLFFKGEFWERLIVNTGIVLVFLALYLRFIKTR
jgi:protein-S-isoprenylcysteine O-methyltransferase Ste14